MTKVGVVGARGRMGRGVVRVVDEAPDLDVAAEVDQGDHLDALAGCNVVVDFTHPGAVMENLRWCVEHDLDVVVGTWALPRTGWTRSAGGWPITRTCMP